MLHKKNPAYFEEELVQNSKNPEDYGNVWGCRREHIKNFAEQVILFEPRENANIFKKFCSKLVTEEVTNCTQQSL